MTTITSSGPTNGQSLLTIDLGALASNYKALNALAKNAECAAVVKADAYGLGVSPAVEALYQAGARTFFTAHLDEALAVRKRLKDCRIYVLHGLKETEIPLFLAHDILPVLGTKAQVELWVRYHHSMGRCASGALHVETGINRLALSPNELRDIEKTYGEEALAPSLIMSHLASGDEPANPSNAQQLANFKALKDVYPRVPRSLSASSGIFLGPDYHFDLVRAGISLYGGHPVPEASDFIKQTAFLDGHVMQVHPVKKGEAIGYGGSFVAPKDMQIAVVAAGYADGYFRALSNKAKCHFKGEECSLVGRVSMDMITIDVTHIATIQEGDKIQLLGCRYDVNSMAEDAGTISYEILTSLGRRYRRQYI